MKKSICLFGDSIAKGVAFDTEQNKYMLLKRSFSKLMQENNFFSVTNYAKFGCTAGKALEMIRQKASKLSSFDYIALELGGNDCDFDWQQISDDPEGMYQPNTPISVFRDIYGQIIDEIRNAGSNPILLSLPPIDAKRYFKWISREKNAAAILKWLGDEEHIYRWHEMYNTVLFEISKKKNVPIINITEKFLVSTQYQSYICQDGIHLNEAGHQLVYDSLCEYIHAHESFLSSAG